MNNYYERIMSCGCGYTMRQTIRYLPMNHLAAKMAAYSELEFQGRHRCHSTVTYTNWRRAVDIVEKSYM